MALLGVLFFIGLEPLTAVIVFGIADVAATITLIVLLNRHLPLRRVQIREARREVRPIFSFAFPLWLSGLLSQFRRNIEAVMLGALSTVANVGILSIVDRVNLVGHTVYRSIIVSVKPVLARLHDQQDRPGLAHLYTATTRWTLSLNLPFFLVIVLYPEALLGIFGESFTTGAGALVVFAFAELVIAGTGTCGSVIDMTGHTRAKLVNSVLWISLLLASNALLIPRWGVIGAAVASLIASAAVNLARLIEVWALEGLIPYEQELLETGSCRCRRLCGRTCDAGLPSIRRLVRRRGRPGGARSGALRGPATRLRTGTGRPVSDRPGYCGESGASGGGRRSVKGQFPLQPGVSGADRPSYGSDGGAMCLHVGKSYARAEPPPSQMVTRRRIEGEREAARPMTSTASVSERSDLPTLGLPLDHPRVPGRAVRRAIERHLLDADLTERLVSMAAASEATPRLWCISAFSAVVSRYGRQSELLMGCAASGDHTLPSYRWPCPSMTSQQPPNG